MKKRKEIKRPWWYRALRGTQYYAFRYWAIVLSAFFLLLALWFWLCYMPYLNQNNECCLVKEYIQKVRSAEQALQECCECQTEYGPGDPAPCDAGMDVVFLVDYTFSMKNAINNVKNQIANIANTIVTESGGDYRLGLVIYDETKFNQAPNYANSVYYTSLPSSAKYLNNNPAAGKAQHITALTQMSSKNIADFSNSLNALQTPSFPIGIGEQAPEPATMGLSRIINNSLVGGFRNNVAKFVVLITDMPDGGDDDFYNQSDIDYADVLKVQAFNSNTQVLLMTTYPEVTSLDEIAIYSGGAVLNSHEAGAVQQIIEDICTANAVTPSL